MANPPFVIPTMELPEAFDLYSLGVHPSTWLEPPSKACLAQGSFPDFKAFPEWEWSLLDVCPPATSLAPAPAPAPAPPEPPKPTSNVCVTSSGFIAERVPNYRPLLKRKSEKVKEAERHRVETCKVLARENRVLVDDILKLDPANRCASRFKELCRAPRTRAIPYESYSRVSMEPFQHVVGDWGYIVASGILPRGIPYIPPEFWKDLKLVVTTKERCLGWSVAEIISKAEVLRKSRRESRMNSSLYSNCALNQLIALNADLQTELLSLGNCKHARI